MEDQFEFEFPLTPTDACEHEDSPSQAEQTMSETTIVVQEAADLSSASQSDDPTLEAAKQRFRKGAATAADYRVLWRTYCKPALESGRSVLYGSPEHIAQSADDRSRAEAALKTIMDNNEKPTKTKIMRLASVPESTATTVVRNHHNSEFLARRRKD